MGNESSGLLSEMCTVDTECERRRLENRLRGRLRLGTSEKILSDKFLLLSDVQDNPTARRILHIYTDKNREINVSEFIKGLLLFSTDGDMLPKLQLSFQIYDFDGDGYISITDLYQVLRQLLGSRYTDISIKEMAVSTVMVADKDGDMKLSFEEYTKFMENVRVFKKVKEEPTTVACYSK